MLDVGWVIGKDPYPMFTGAAWTPTESGKADLQFRRQQSFTVSAKKLEAVGQMGMPIFLAVRLLGSVTRHTPDNHLQFQQYKLLSNSPPLTNYWRALVSWQRSLIFGGDFFVWASCYACLLPLTKKMAVLVAARLDKNCQHY